MDKSINQSEITRNKYRQIPVTQGTYVIKTYLSLNQCCGSGSALLSDGWIQNRIKDCKNDPQK
jgi:hypothetical protein